MGLVRKLLSLGHDVIAIAPNDRHSEKLVKAGCQFENLTMDSRGISPLRDAALVIELFKIYKRTTPDIILHFTIKPNIYGTLAAHWLKIPVINNVSGLGTVFLWKNIASRLAIKMYRLVFRYADFVFFQNSDDKDHFLEMVGLRNLKSDVLPGSGIDITKFHPNGKLRNKKFTFLLIARLLIDKGIEEYIEAIKLLRKEGVDAKFQLLGNIDTDHKRGIPLVKIKNWINEGYVDYKGSTDDVKSYINKADCIVLPSYREGTPRTLLEGASMGKALIASDVAGCNSVVIDGVNGYLCRVKDANDLALKMKQMSELSTEALISMGKESRILIENTYNEDFVVQKYISTISTLIPKSKTNIQINDGSGKPSLNGKAQEVIISNEIH